MVPPSVTVFVPAGHFSHGVRGLVRGQLDLSAITGDDPEARGYPPYDPRMMTALLSYAYCQGVYASRRMARSGDGHEWSLIRTAHTLLKLEMAAKQAA